MGAKSLSYAVNMAAQRWARAHHADDAIFAAAGGLVREATTSAVVIARGQQLLSPPVSLGILPSITVGRLFACAAAAGWETGFDRLTDAGPTASGCCRASDTGLHAQLSELAGSPKSIAP
jgi:4-amino-4-deoxychorismate lyase